MRERNEEDGLANLSVDEAHPTWETRFLVDDHPPSAQRLQRRVAPTEERHKPLSWQSDESK